MTSRASKSALLHMFICAMSLSYGFSDWVNYRQKFVNNPNGWHLYFIGGVEAPWQYRIGVWMAVDWMNRWLDWKPYDTLTAIDIVCLALALWCMLFVLRHSRFYGSATGRTRWLALAGALFLAEYYLAWGHWYQTGVTMPSILFVALSMALISGSLLKNKPVACLLLVALAWVQGFIRADTAVILHAGIFVALLLNRQMNVPLGRARQLVTSALISIMSGCIQLYLMLVRFPDAKYGPGGVIRLAENIQPGMWLTMLLALLPYFLLLVILLSRRYRPVQYLPGGPATMLLTASVLYLAVWATMGLLDEVRIFLPFAFALIPETTLVFIRMIPKRESDAETVDAGAPAENGSASA